MTSDEVIHNCFEPPIIGIFGTRTKARLAQAAEVIGFPKDKDGRPCPVLVYCPSCGKTYVSGETHCSYCGSDVHKDCS